MHEATVVQLMELWTEEKVWHDKSQMQEYIEFLVRDPHAQHETEKALHLFEEHEDDWTDRQRSHYLRQILVVQKRLTAERDTLKTEKWFKSLSDDDQTAVLQTTKAHVLLTMGSASTTSSPDSERKIQQANPWDRLLSAGRI